MTLADDMSELMPRVVPAGWRCVETLQDGARFVNGTTSGRLWSVIMSVWREQDGKRWVHLSTAFGHRLPTWDELVTVRDIFLPGKKCIQVIAIPDEHVNIHPFCLHLWHCLDGDGLPDFTHGSGSL